MEACIQSRWLLVEELMYPAVQGYCVSHWVKSTELDALRVWLEIWNKLGKIDIDHQSRAVHWAAGFLCLDLRSVVCLFMIITACFIYFTEDVLALLMLSASWAQFWTLWVVCSIHYTGHAYVLLCWWPYACLQGVSLPSNRQSHCSWKSPHCLSILRDERTTLCRSANRTQEL